MNPVLAAVGLLLICAVVTLLVVGIVAGLGLLVMQLLDVDDRLRPAAFRTAGRIRWWTVALGTAGSMYAVFLVTILMLPEFPGEFRSYLPLVPFAVFLGGISGLAGAVVFLLTVSRSRSVAG